MPNTVTPAIQNAFEAMLHRRAAAGNPTGGPIVRNEDGTYASKVVQVLWEVYQAGRASAVVHIPAELVNVLNLTHDTLEPRDAMALAAQSIHKLLTQLAAAPRTNQKPHGYILTSKHGQAGSSYVPAGDIDCFGHSYNRLALYTHADPATAIPPELPPKVYLRVGRFYDAETCRSMNSEFHGTWEHLAHKFPTSAAEALGRPAGKAPSKAALQALE